MDHDVLALLRRAEHDLRCLVRDAERHMTAWGERRRLLVELERIATDLVEASRHYAEHLSRETGGHRTEPGGQ